jgi:Phage terminase large subunit gpA, ATPase domain
VRLLPSCSPKWATRRRPERESFGGELIGIGAALGQPFMPHQREIALTGGEIDRDTGLPAYRKVIVTVPRQTGKTTLFVSWQIHRCTAPRWAQPQRSAFTAQSGKDARDKWLDELFPLIRRSKVLKPLVRRIYEGMGNEYIKFTNGSLIRLLSTSTSSGHSKTLHQAVLDEIWHDQDGRREQGLGPAMITVADAQLLMCSTAGTDASVVLDRYMRMGRAAVEADTGRGIAYFEYSAPDGWDPADEASYFGFMPALCPAPPCRCGQGKWRHTVTLDAIRSERLSMEPSEFARAYGNVPHRAADGRWRVVPRAAWEPWAEPRAPRPSPVVFAAEMSWDDRHGVIGMAGHRPDGLVQVELAELPREGSGWMVRRLVELADEWRPAAIVIDPGGPARQVIDATEVAGLVVAKPAVRDVAGACGQFADLCRDGGLRHLGQGELTASVAQAVKHEFGSLWAWERKAPNAAPLMAVTLALWGLGKFGAAGDYTIGESVGFDAAEVARLLRAGVYGQADVERLAAAGIISAGDAAQLVKETV